MSGILTSPGVPSWQAILTPLFAEALPVDPPDPGTLLVSNLIARVLAHIVGANDAGAVLVKASADGRLLVSGDGPNGPITTQDVWEGTAADTYGTEHAYAVSQSQIVVAVAAYNAKVEWSSDGSTYNTEFTLNAGEIVTIPATVRAINIKNASAGSNATFRIWGFA